jgi:hypothetical protein
MDLKLLRHLMARLIEQLATAISYLASANQLLCLMTRSSQALHQQMQIKTLFTGHFFIKAELKTEQNLLTRAKSQSFRENHRNSPARTCLNNNLHSQVLAIGTQAADICMLFLKQNC